MKKTFDILVCLVILLTVSCTSCGSPQQKETLSATGSGDGAPTELPLPDVPVTITDPQGRADYLITHFWDSMDFADRSLSLDTIFMEQNFANYIALFPHATPQARTEAARSLIDKAADTDSQSLLFLSSIIDKYLYHPDSPMSDEATFLLFAEAIVDRQDLPDEAKARTAHLISSAKKNAPGTKAADFTFTTPDGRPHRLLAELNKGTADISADDAATLLIFYDPDCESCKETISALADSPRLTADIKAGRTKVIAIYPDADHKDLWRAGLNSIPSDWMTGIDTGEIDAKELYDFPVMPVIYLLATDGTVIGKDINRNILM